MFWHTSHCFSMLSLEDTESLDQDGDEEMSKFLIPKKMKLKNNEVKILDSPDVGLSGIIFSTSEEFPYL